MFFKFSKIVAATVVLVCTSAAVHAQTNLALSATAAHSGGGATSAGYGPENYNDNVIAACGSTPWGWVSTGGWIEFTWSSPQNVAKVVFIKDNRPMTICVVEYWNGSSYSTIMNYSNSSTCADSITFTPVSTTKLRFNNVSGSSNPNHRERQIYGPPCSTAVTVEPVPLTVCEKKQAVFSITAIDATAYQWQVDEGSGFFDVSNNIYYSGATTSTLTINNTPVGFDGNKYRCIPTKITCRDTSNAVTLNVNGLVSAEDMPANDTTCIHGVKDLKVTASGTIASYRWQVFIPGTGYVDVPQAPPYTHNANVLNISDVPDTLDGAKFRCLINGVCDSMVSTESRLTVNLVPTVVVPPADVTAEQGDDVTFQAQASAVSAKYQWEVAAPDTFVVINEGGIYSGVKTDRLTVKGVARVQNGFKFRCVVRSGQGCNSPGDTSEFAVLTVNPPASVTMMTRDGKMILYPNPVNGNELFIQAAGNKAMPEHMKYKISDKAGRTIVVGNVNNSGNTRIDVGNLPADMYLVEILDGHVPVATARFTKL